MRIAEESVVKGIAMMFFLFFEVIIANSTGAHSLPVQCKRLPDIASGHYVLECEANILKAKTETIQSGLAKALRSNKIWDPQLFNAGTKRKTTNMKHVAQPRRFAGFDVAGLKMIRVTYH